MSNKVSGQCTPDLFKQIFVLYSPERIKAIRKALRETREEFGRRFFVTEEAVKNWESPEYTKKHRELPGPAARLMLLVEYEALKKRNAHCKVLRTIRKLKEQELAERFDEKSFW